MRKSLFINGEWVGAANVQDLYSPYSGEKIAEIPLATHQEVDAAVQAAYNARKQLKKMPAHERAQILENVSRLIEENREECARLIAVEAAKPIQTARGEVARSLMTYKLASEEARRLPNEMVNMDAVPGGENRTAYAVREPAGVVAAITPFNFPMNLVAHKLGPAIASGCPVVLKPASQTPLSAFFIAELFEKAGLPKGALNVITGKGSVVGEALVTDDRVKVITFTGSPEVGMSIRNKAGLKKVTLELGSNSAVIIDEGTDIEAIADRIATGAFTYQGQVCISVQRIFVHESCYKQLIKKMKEKAENMVLGDPLDEGTQISAMISPEEKDRVLSWINEAAEQGAKIVTGGEENNGMITPAVIENVAPSMKVSCEEVFGPVVTISPFKEWEEAIGLVNNSDFGLQAGVYTEKISHAFHASEELEVGGVMINDFPTFRVDHMPYGGMKKSGSGREGIKYAIEEMTEIKLVSFNNSSFK
ncbi:aldehyde dehydrogenase family protein [Salipaludibacillus aurantiacus]|uniref:Acyl-CoA reductase n=1 Tax=Salipaludibacillus aurantiacus TaxID=1601833 RepID=A0A1H9NZV9_9BACI|nr:aldehyde dehydrogenase family protein [Salipaludibacillus aurantiacus]SER41506.1 Acyl-CoA reductase [Salipaludibacillus aurantiacus]